MSINIEIPKEESLKALAPEKNHKSIFLPMSQIQQGVLENKEDRKKYRHAPRFVPAGQSTQMIVGATKETDLDILKMSNAMYQQPTMRRVYYSGYVSVNTYDPRLPVLKQPPLVRENRLYQESALLIVNSRRFNRVTSYHLKKMGVVLKKAKYFITCGELTSSFSQPIIGINEIRPERLRPMLLSKAQQKRAAAEQQLMLDFKDDNEEGQ